MSREANVVTQILAGWVLVTSAVEKKIQNHGFAARNVAGNVRLFGNTHHVLRYGFRRISPLCSSLIKKLSQRKEKRNMRSAAIKHVGPVTMVAAVASLLLSCPEYAVILGRLVRNPFCSKSPRALMPIYRHCSPEILGRTNHAGGDGQGYLQPGHAILVAHIGKDPARRCGHLYDVRSLWGADPSTQTPNCFPN